MKQPEKLPRPIFLFGLTVRVGTNYMGSLMSKVDAVTSVPKTISQGEFPLFRNEVQESLISFLNNFNKKSFGVDDLPSEVFQKRIGSLFLNYFKERYKINTPYIFLKDPNTRNTHLVWNYFESPIVIFLIRNGQDFVSSFSKGSQLQRRSYPPSKKIKSFVKHVSGYQFISACRSFNQSVDKFKKNLTFIKEKGIEDEIQIISFEELNRNPVKVVEKILDKIHYNLSDSEKAALNNAEIVGSSFGSNDGKVQNWGKQVKPENFNPVGRSERWSFLQKLVFKIFSQKKNDQLKAIYKSFNE